MGKLSNSWGEIGGERAGLTARTRQQECAHDPSGNTLVSANNFFTNNDAAHGQWHRVSRMHRNDVNGKKHELQGLLRNVAKAGFVNRKPLILATVRILKLYYRLTGGVDSGLAELDVLNYWRQQNVSDDEILVYVSIDPKNPRASSRPWLVHQLA
jgi:hypothetical protein